MKWYIDGHDRLVMSVTKKEQRSLKAAQRRDERGQCQPPFDSDDFMHELFDPLVTSGEYTWLPEGCTDDLTSAPMLGVLGDEMAGPDDPQDATGMGLVYVGCWEHEGRLRQMYRPVLKRWGFMSFAVTSPQRDLAENRVCTWDGGDFWSRQVAAVNALSEFENREIGCGAK